MNNWDFLSQVKIEKEQEQRRSPLANIGEINTTIITKRKGKGHMTGKENLPLFTPISTKDQEVARLQLLNGRSTRSATSSGRPKAMNIVSTYNSWQPQSDCSFNKSILNDFVWYHLLLQDVGLLTEASKQVICMKAMGLSKCSEVDSKLKAFIQETNKLCKTTPKAFTKHIGKPATELLDMVTTWCIMQNLVTIRDPPGLSQDGIQRIFPENVIRTPGHDLIAL